MSLTLKATVICTSSSVVWSGMSEMVGGLLMELTVTRKLWRTIDRVDGHSEGARKGIIGGLAVIDCNSDNRRAEGVWKRSEAEAATARGTVVKNGWIGDQRRIAGGGGNSERFGFIGGAAAHAIEIDGLGRSILVNG